MSRSSSSSENLFLRWHASWSDKGLKLRGLLVLLALAPLFGMLILLLWFGNFQMPRDAAAQADAAGAELSRQIAASAADPLAANDNLSLNILLAQWNQNPLVAHTSVSTVDNRVVAEAGQRPSRDNLAPGQGRFVASIHLQDVLAGQLQMSLAAEPFTAPGKAFLRHALWSLLVLSLIALVIAWRVAASMSKTMQGLGEWYGDSDRTAPGVSRRDELGDLARRLAARGIIDMPPPLLEEVIEEPEQLEEVEIVLQEDDPDASIIELPEPAPVDITSAVQQWTPAQEESENSEEQAEAGSNEATVDVEAEVLQPDDAPAPDSVVTEPVAPTQSSAVLAVRLGNQEALKRLPRPRLIKLLDSYREHVQQACEIYQGKLHTLHDGTSLMVFAADDAEDREELTRALTCGELLRVLGHDMQIEIADTGISLHLQLAACWSEDLPDVEKEDFADESDCQKMLDNIQYSRNLLLLDVALATSDETRERAVVRKLASQPGVYCVERLIEPYQTVLERQLNTLYTQRRS